MPTSAGGGCCLEHWSSALARKGSPARITKTSHSRGNQTTALLGQNRLEDRIRTSDFNGRIHKGGIWPIFCRPYVSVSRGGKKNKASQVKTAICIRVKLILQLAGQKGNSQSPWKLCKSSLSKCDTRKRKLRNLSLES